MLLHQKVTNFNADLTHKAKNNYSAPLLKIERP